MKKLKIEGGYNPDKKTIKLDKEGRLMLDEKVNH